MTQDGLGELAMGHVGHWTRVVALASAALFSNPAMAHGIADNGLHKAKKTGSLRIPELGFGTAGQCNRTVSPINSSLGRAGGFDLANLGAPIEAPLFGLQACKKTTASLARHDPDIDGRSVAMNDSALADRQFTTPGSASGPIDSHTEPDKPRVSKDVFSGTYALIGVSLGSIPTYEGSSNARIMPVPGAMGRIGGVEFRLAGPSLTLDFIQGTPGAKLGLALGPSIRYRFNRNGKSGDAVVDQLGKLKGVIEAGVNAGVTIKRVLSKYDLLSVGVSARWDISGRGSGLIVSPSASYLLPVSKAQVVGVLVSADFVDKRYARYNYSVTPAGSAASGLPAYTARGGLKQGSVGAFTARDLSGNILDGGFAVGLGALYSRLYGSAAKTPITALRGSRNQWILGGGLTYTF